MDFYSVLSLAVLIAAVLAAMTVRKRKAYKYTLLDISGTILNAVFGVMVYPPLCVSAQLIGAGGAGLLTVMGRLMPAICVAGIGMSVLLRRRENPAKSFLVQFAGLAFYLLLLLVAVCSGRL